MARKRVPQKGVEKKKIGEEKEEVVYTADCHYPGCGFRAEAGSAADAKHQLW